MNGFAEDFGSLQCDAGVIHRLQVEMLMRFCGSKIHELARLALNNLKYFIEPKKVFCIGSIKRANLPWFSVRMRMKGAQKPKRGPTLDLD